MAKFFTSRVNELKKETRQVKDFLNGKTVNEFPMILLTIIVIAFIFTSLYLYFNVLRNKNT
jgi:hypothetical protein